MFYYQSLMIKKTMYPMSSAFIFAVPFCIGNSNNYIIAFFVIIIGFCIKGVPKKNYVQAYDLYSNLLS